MDRKNKVQLPEKKTVNLVPHEIPVYRTSAFLIGTAVIVAMATLFSLFAVVGPLREAAKARAEADAAEARLYALRAENTAYDAVRAEYSRYFSAAMGDKVLAVSSVEALDLVESVLRPDVGIQNLTFSNGTLTVCLIGTNLTETARLHAALSESPLVQNVTFTFAGDKTVSGETTSVNMTVVFRAEGGGEG